MENVVKTLDFLGVFTFALTAVGQQSGGGQGTQSEACRAYAGTAGGTMTGGTMTGGASLQLDQVQGAIQSAISCLGELRADIESGRNADQAALALFNIRQDLGRAFQAAQMVEESNKSLLQLEALQQQVSEQREEAVASLDQVTESLSALSASRGTLSSTMTGGGGQ
jgi:hypothetical protein